MVSPAVLAWGGEQDPRPAASPAETRSAQSFRDPILVEVLPAVDVQRGPRRGKKERKKKEELEGDSGTCLRLRQSQEAASSGPVSVFINARRVYSTAARCSDHPARRDSRKDAVTDWMILVPHCRLETRPGSGREARDFIRH